MEVEKGTQFRPTRCPPSTRPITAQTVYTVFAIDNIVFAKIGKQTSHATGNRPDVAKIPPARKMSFDQAVISRRLTAPRGLKWRLPTSTNCEPVEDCPYTVMTVAAGVDHTPSRTTAGSGHDRCATTKDCYWFERWEEVVSTRICRPASSQITKNPGGCISETPSAEKRNGWVGACWTMPDNRLTIT